jgi:hypothetical protein
MRFGVRRPVDLDHHAVRTDQNGDPFRPFLRRIFRGAIGNGDRPVGVAQKLGFEADLLPPALQIVGRAEGDSEKDGVFVGKVRGSITEPTGFFRSAVAEGARVEPDEHVLTRVVRQAHLLAVLIRQGEGRGLISNVR